MLGAPTTAYVRLLALAISIGNTDASELPASAFTTFTSGASCEANGAGSLRTLVDCSAAAAALYDTTAEEDGQNDFPGDPPYCYFKYGSIKFNLAGTNTGDCSRNDVCVCWVPDGGGRGSDAALTFAIDGGGRGGDAAPNLAIDGGGCGDDAALTLARGFDQVSILLEAVKADMGVAVLQRCLVRDALHAGQVVAPFDLPITLSRGYFLCSPREKREHPALHVFRDWLLAVAQTDIEVLTS